MERIGGSIARRWMMLAASNCFDRWQENVADKKYNIRLMQKISTRWLKASMGKAFETWQSGVFVELKLSDMLELDDKIHEFQAEIEARLSELDQTKADNDEAIARLNKLNEAMLGEKENELMELHHAVATHKDTLHQRKDVIEMQKKQLEDESRKHHTVNEQLNDVESQLRTLKSENLQLSTLINTLEGEYEMLQTASAATEQQLSSERSHLTAKLTRLNEELDNESCSFQKQEVGLQQELSALETALRNKERELVTANAEREESEARAVMELDSARQTLANSEKKIKDMTQRMQEQHTQIMWLDESLQKEKKKAVNSGNSSPLRRGLASGPTARG